MRRTVAVLSAFLMVLGLAGTASAANPNRSYVPSACYAGNEHVTVEQVWAGFNVDGVTVIIGNGEVGLGDIYSISRSRSGDEQSTLGYDPESTQIDATLTFHGKVVASRQIDIPSGGWPALPAC
jgi:hypothetical protein